MIKKIVSVFAVISILFIFCLSGCTIVKGSYITKNSISNSTKYSFSNKYEYFNGNKTYYINVVSVCNLNFIIETNSGELNCKIIDPNGDIIYNEENIQTTKEKIYLNVTGKCIIEIIANKHSGLYSFDWSDIIDNSSII